MPSSRDFFQVSKCRAIPFFTMVQSAPEAGEGVSVRAEASAAARQRAIAAERERNFPTYFPLCLYNSFRRRIFSDGLPVPGAGKRLRQPVGAII